MLDVQGSQYVNCRVPATVLGRWVGAGAAVPTPVTGTTRALGSGKGFVAQGGGVIAISRSGVGALSVTIPERSGVVQNYSFWTASGASATDKNVRVTPPSAGSLTFTLAVTFHANGTAVDLASNDELLMWVTMSLSQNP